MYASVLSQDLLKYQAVLCVSVAEDMTTEKFIHVELIGPPIHGDETEISHFAKVKILGTCRSRYTPGLNAVPKMMPIGEKLRLAIVSAPGFQEAVVG